MGSGPMLGSYADYEAAEKAEALKRAHEGKGHPPAREPPPGRGAVIEHDANERRPYVPKALRK